MVSEEDVYALATRNRLLAADMFAGLSEAQWTTPSLCAGWSVREVCAHLVPPPGGHRLLPLVGAVLRFRGDLARLVDVTTRERAAATPTDQLVAELQERAGDRLEAPVVGALGPMVDTAIHLRDAARPLGLDVGPPPDDWRPVLDFLRTGPAERGFVGRGRTAGLRLEASDTDWSSGAGDLVRGAAEALALAVAGRPVAYAELEGPGVEVLRSRDR
ncbi:maleylpyruvate isomerase family mycothiol-dependent enzyme [Nocardioides sp. J2M5]|uniref:maleylpyruvate isomerase family mycothiol-dependent enzyme n=1 Tax=Nocardioides palaemonis TaxID=2829810 RepID=UPI001BA55853|nr:maleylpyruvate isomerase family mycothiol-dependent enzyme [Nocardioides palaemonis]MBS2937450.1 maleylpyruvate isomerase family mycothiol-dependent enzyme [Nocardioides palaemonis]